MFGVVNPKTGDVLDPEVLQSLKEVPPSPPCLHEYVYGGVKFRIGHKLMGSAARAVFYYDWFYCSKCLEDKFRRLSYKTNTYEDIRNNATPLPFEHGLPPL